MNLYSSISFTIFHEILLEFARVADDTYLLSGLISKTQIALSGSIILLTFAMYTQGSFWGSLEATMLIGIAAVAAGVATNTLSATKQEIKNSYFANLTEANKTIKAINFLIYVVGAYTIALCLALVSSLMPEIGVICFTAANILLVINVMLITDLPRRFFLLNNSCHITITKAQVLTILISTALFMMAVILYGVIINQVPVGIKPGETLL
jgi:hypothetical protein